ncbi:hypothetical protein V500_06202 [Pseudogymnoascus sp. VKM F-4518 (FW-2643)]|nr:hypothetical protein V500_06202 [Pseudogymnoascus sp. VKM F-4518 (FW-2643)]
MWSNNNFGSNSAPAPAQDGAEDNDHQSNTNRENFQENYQGSVIDQGNDNFVNFPPLTGGFPVYPLFPFEYYQPPNSSYMGGYMPNMFQQMPGFGNNGYLQTAFTNPANLEEAHPSGSVAMTHPGVSTQSVPPIRPIAAAQTDAPTQPIALAKPTTSMALTTRAEELKAQLIKSKEERAKAKTAPKADKAGAGSLDPTSQEMASLLRGSPTKPRNMSKGPTSGSTVFSTSPESIPRRFVVVNTGSKSTRSENPAEYEVTKLIAAGKAAAEEDYKKHLGANGLPASKIGPSADVAGVVQNNAQSKGSQTKLNLMHSKPALSQVKAFHDTEQKRTVSEKPKEKVQTEEVVGKGKLPSTPNVAVEQVPIKFHSSTITQDKMPAPRHGYPGRRGSNVNTIDKPRIDNCGKDKDNSNARNSTNTIHSPREDKHSPLEKILLSDDDLRDWLKLTKWDDLAHRKRALERHRAIIAIDTEKARLLESVAKIEALDKEKAKLVAKMIEDEDGFGDKSPRGPTTKSTARAIGGSDTDSLDSLDQTTKPTPASVTPRKRSFSSFTNSNRIPLQPNSRRSRAADAQRSSPSNTGRELFDDRHEHRGRSRERRGFNDPRDMSPRLRAFLEREDAREARETAARRHNAELRGNHREEYRSYRGYRGQYRGRGRGYIDERR